MCYLLKDLNKNEKPYHTDLKGNFIYWLMIIVVAVRYINICSKEEKQIFVLFVCFVLFCFMVNLNSKSSNSAIFSLPHF